MITYCIGSARTKRDYFMKAEDILFLDNTEVLFCAFSGGRNYFAIGDVPFSGFTVRAYLGYKRALCEKKVDDALIRRFGLDPNARLGRLAPAQMRVVTFLEKTAGETDKTVAVNLDGSRYSRRAAAALTQLLAAVREAYVCITDTRFLRRAGKNARTVCFGADVRRRPVFYKAVRLARLIGAKRISVV